MNRHQRRQSEHLKKRRIRQRKLNFSGVNLNRLEKQTAITEIQAEYLQGLMNIYRKQKIHTSPKAQRVAKILLKPRCKSLWKFHNELIKPNKKDKPEIQPKPKKKSLLRRIFNK